VQRTLAPIGEKWIVLIARNAANGVSRFDDFRRHIGMSDAVLSDCDAILSHLERPGGDLQLGKGRPRHRARGLTTHVCDWEPCSAIGWGRSDEATPRSTDNNTGVSPAGRPSASAAVRADQPQSSSPGDRRPAPTRLIEPRPHG
jgi:hypothetical protein